MKKTVFLPALILAVVVLSILLFVGGPDKDQSIILKQLWGSGHFFLFAGLVYLLAQVNFVQEKSALLLFLATTIFCLSVGLLTEFIQQYVGREFQLKDILNDLLGGYAGLLGAMFSRRNTKLNQLLLAVGTISLFILGTQSLARSIINQWQIEQNFPVLADFEQFFELDRWVGRNAEISITDSHKRHGQYALRIELLPAQYPGVSLHQLVSDWSQFETLHFSVYNPNEQSMRVVLKVYDRVHPSSGYQFKDRFNQSVMLLTGWNDLKFSVNAIENAPLSRKMDLSSIVSLSLFTINLAEPAVIVLDHVKLEKNQH